MRLTLRDLEEIVGKVQALEKMNIRHVPSFKCCLDNITVHLKMEDSPGNSVYEPSYDITDIVWQNRESLAKEA